MASPLVRPPLPSAGVQKRGSDRISAVLPVLHRRAPSSGFGAVACWCSAWRSEREVRVLGAAGARAAGQWEVVTLTCRSAGKVTCLGGWKKRDAARKALEDALVGKKDVVDKWNEEIKKRQESGGSKGRGRGRGWGGGGGGGGRGGGSGGEGDEIDPDAGNRWEEVKQIAYAFFGLLSLYLVLTQGKAMLAIAVNVLFFVVRGFKRSPSYRPPPSKTEAASGAPSLGPLALGNAEADVISKWGKD